MQNIALTLSFDGSFYHGWQYQKNAVSVCETIMNALYKITGKNIDVIGCSRTDAGVHAILYVCNFKTDISIPPDRIMFALNTKLPKSIRIISSEQKDDDFHARFSAKSKTYLYKAYTSPVENPFLINYAYHFPYKIECEKIRRAAKHFIGTHDFTAFMSTGSSQKTTVRTVNSLEVQNYDDMIEFEINANSYLYNMVRIIAGTLLYVGCGRIEADDIPDIIKSGDRRRAGITAAPQGLYLKNIFY